MLVPPGGHYSNPDRLAQIVQLLEAVRRLKASDTQSDDVELV